MQCLKGDTVSACAYSLISLGMPIPLPGRSGGSWWHIWPIWLDSDLFCVQFLGEILWFTRVRTVALHYNKTTLAKCKPRCSHYCSARWLSLTSQLHKEAGLLFWNHKSECLFDIWLLDFYFKYHCYFLATASWSKSNSCFETQTKLQLHLHESFLE